MDPVYAKLHLLWMIEEIGECVSIIKKQGDSKIINNQTTRRHFIEEMSDVLMYFTDVLNRYNISTTEFSKIYKDKITINKKRHYK
jgi:NTP pyrophosphatase (non-canonical NTP hydrolase)